MKNVVAIIAVALLAACTSPSDDANAPDAAKSDTPQPAAQTESMQVSQAPATEATASATGTVEAIDAAAKTVTIAHGPVDALKLPAMTMTFQAPNADLALLKPGDRVAFEFTSAGQAIITKIDRQ